MIYEWKVDEKNQAKGRERKRVRDREGQKDTGSCRAIV